MNVSSLSTVVNAHSTLLLIFLAVLSCVFYVVYWLRIRCRYDSSLPPLTVGLPTGLVADKQAHGFFRALFSELGLVLRRRVTFAPVAADIAEAMLLDKRIDVAVFGAGTLVNTSQVELLPCYRTEETSLALVFWDRMPSHVTTLQDYAMYPSNATVVLKSSFEENYLAAFERIESVSVDTLNEFMTRLKMGIVRSGLIRSEHAIGLQREYCNLKVMPVAIQKQCTIITERLGVARTNQNLLVHIEHALAHLHQRRIVDRLQDYWFSKK